MIVMTMVMVITLGNKSVLDIHHETNCDTSPNHKHSQHKKQHEIHKYNNQNHKITNIIIVINIIMIIISMVMIRMIMIMRMAVVVAVRSNHNETHMGGGGATGVT